MLLCCASAFSRQITYTRALGSGRYQIRQMDADGKNLGVVDYGFSKVGFPTWSPDGSRLAVTMFRPTRANNKSWNVFQRRPGSATVIKLTRYRDILDDKSLSFSYTFPWSKAFSPNNRFLATFSIVQSGGGGGSGVAEMPVLEIHNLRQTANPILVHVDKTRNGRHHAGEGVSWSSARNLLAAPLQTSTPFASTSGNGDTTALYLIPPSLNAVNTGLARQLTFPRADANIGTGVMWTEHDYAPSFSPNGSRIAFVRSFQSHPLLTSLNPDPVIQSIIIKNMNTGAERVLRTFPRGTYITTVDWSPTGNRLVFDLAKQVVNPLLGPLQQGDEATNQIYRINDSGGGLTQLRGNGNGTPSWR